MRAKIIAFCCVALLSHGAHAGDIYRCVAASGDVMFTNMACPPNSLVQHVASYEPVPDAPAPRYDAAADAAASALAARNAAEQARGAAYQARAAYEQAQAEAQGDESSDEADYAGWIPYYPQIGTRFRDRRHYPRQPLVAHSAAHMLHASGPASTLHR